MTTHVGKKMCRAMKTSFISFMLILKFNFKIKIIITNFLPYFKKRRALKCLDYSVLLFIKL